MARGLSLTVKTVLIKEVGINGAVLFGWLEGLNSFCKDKKGYISVLLYSTKNILQMDSREIRDILNKLQTLGYIEYREITASIVKVKIIQTFNTFTQEFELVN